MPSAPAVKAGCQSNSLSASDRIRVERRLDSTGAAAATERRAPARLEHTAEPAGPAVTRAILQLLHAYIRLPQQPHGQ